MFEICIVEELYLDYNEFNGTLIDCIGANLRKLRRLHLFGNHFSGTIPSTLGQLQNIGEDKCIIKYALLNHFFSLFLVL